MGSGQGLGLEGGDLCLVSLDFGVLSLVGSVECLDISVEGVVGSLEGIEPLHEASSSTDPDDGEGTAASSSSIVSDESNAWTTKFSSYTLPPSGTPSIDLSESPSYSPEPTNQSSFRPSVLPTVSSSTQPSIASSTSPSFAPSNAPTASPTDCPEQLLKSARLGDDELLTIKYEVVTFPNGNDAGGLLCVSLEYSGEAGWMGLAFSEASRAPQFGRKEAIIGLSGMVSTVAVVKDRPAGLGQQLAPLTGGPAFFNPGKYVIPAGGIGKDAYSGPSLQLLTEVDKQTLMNATVVADAYAQDGFLTDQRVTRMSFAKYLREPDEIEIRPTEPTLLLYAVSAANESNPEWKYTYLNLSNDSSGGLSAVSRSGFRRKRLRQHRIGHQEI